MSKEAVHLRNAVYVPKPMPKAQLKSAYRRCLDKYEPAKTNEAGRDLIRAIFGKDSIAEDSVL